jgi:hypothetical protein
MGHSSCQHAAVTCLNVHELIRKYRCADCQGVMMCACDETFGRRFLAHQLSRGVELETQERIPVTHGFQTKICNACRGLPLVPAPAAAIPGRTSKIKRFYWRELFFAKTEQMAVWQQENPNASPDEMKAAQQRIEKEVLDAIKQRHATAPKYDTRELSQSEVLDRYGVQVDAFFPAYTASPEKGATVMWNGEVVSPETFATDQYESEGWLVMRLESAPLHALFGVMMWLLIEDPNDPKCRMAGFGSRTTYEAGEKPPLIMMNLPEDFGTSGYGQRRSQAIDEHLALLTPEREHLLWHFDYWRRPSENLRQYLWAHREPDVDRARRLIEILPAETIIAVLRYLVADYWGHYLGWPDLLLWRDEAFMMVEVKSSSDKLSAEQMQWIADNHDILKLPLRIAKLHRSKSPTERYRRTDRDLAEPTGVRERGRASS